MRRLMPRATDYRRFNEVSAESTRSRHRPSVTFLHLPGGGNILFSSRVAVLPCTGTDASSGSLTPRDLPAAQFRSVDEMWR
jgi:hypothetical protein